jgi:lipopolysaccharide O-acetyltransferase
LTTGVGCRIEAYPFVKGDIIIHFGHNVEINDYVHIAALESVKIGNNVLIASKVFISDISHGTYSGDEIHDSPHSIPKERRLNSKPVIIKDNVWIGENVSIMPGVIIGEGAIVGANTVVTKSVPVKSIVVGNPAKVIKYYNEDTLKWEVL